MKKIKIKSLAFGLLVSIFIGSLSAQEGTQSLSPEINFGFSSIAVILPSALMELGLTHPQFKCVLD